MSEGQTEVVDTTATPAPETGGETRQEQTGFVKPDGTFTEKWRENLPEDLRQDKTLMQFKDFAGLARTVVNQQRMVGLDKKKLVEVPDDKAPDNVKNEFYKAIGRPEKSTDYKFTKDETIPTEVWDDNLIGTALNELHKAGASQKVVDAISRIENQRILAQKKFIEEQPVRTESQLKSEWQNNYEANMHLANLGLENGSGGNAEFKETIKNKFGNDPDFIKAMANLGKNFAEHNNVKPNGQITQSSDEIQTKINELQASKAFLDKRDPAHKTTVDMVTALYQKKHKR